MKTFILSNKNTVGIVVHAPQSCPTTELHECRRWLLKWTCTATTQSSFIPTQQQPALVTMLAFVLDCFVAFLYHYGSRHLSNPTRLEGPHSHQNWTCTAVSCRLVFLYGFQFLDTFLIACMCIAVCTARLLLLHKRHAVTKSAGLWR